MLAHLEKVSYCGWSSSTTVSFWYRTLVGCCLLSGQLWWNI